MYSHQCDQELVACVQYLRIISMQPAPWLFHAAGTVAELVMESTCYVCGYHIYQAVRYAVVRKALASVGKPCSEKDRYAVAVVKTRTVINYLPRYA